MLHPQRGIVGLYIERDSSQRLVTIYISAIHGLLRTGSRHWGESHSVRNIYELSMWPQQR